ncbi:MAG TPA: 50S ribosomal protein L4, partial [Chloroflexi bacterium]|nr:50S ribosomal protein L4 [Chloroflexota bacterium]
RAALRSALSVKAEAQALIFVEALKMETPKTKDLVGVLEKLAVNGQKVLLLLPEANENVQRSARNLPTVRTLRASYLNIRDLLGADHIVVPLEALAVIEDILG